MDSRYADSVRARLGDLFLDNWRELLGDHGFTPDPGKVERTANGVAFYHYTRPEHLNAILAPDSGLRARRPVVYSELSDEFTGGYLVEGLLEPLPRWVTATPYFRNLGLEMLQAYVGNLLLRVEVPSDFPGLYVADYAHCLECKHVERRGQPALGLCYDCTTGHECEKAYLHSYVPLAEYRGGHLAPIVKAVRRGPGIVVPSRFITKAEYQPLLAVH